jgi:hypothetical protein
MRIFVSHASEERSEADRLAIALRARGHHVFLDSDDLPPGGDYQSRIERALAKCDLFCFFISTHSIAPKRFTLSEVNIARRRWPNPIGRVLPVMVERVPLDSIPSYLRSVSILESQGDLVADVLNGIDAMRPKALWRSPVTWAGGAIGFVGLLVALLWLGLQSKGTTSDAPPPAASEAKTVSLSNGTARGVTEPEVRSASLPLGRDSSAPPAKSRDQAAAPNLGVSKEQLLSTMLSNLHAQVNLPSDVRQKFVNGQRAMRRSDWTAAVNHFRQAAAIQPDRADLRVPIDAADDERPYVPNLYAAQAYKQLGDCAGVQESLGKLEATATLANYPDLERDAGALRLWCAASALK